MRIFVFWFFLSELKKEQFDYSPEQAQFSLDEHFNYSIFDTKSVMRIDLTLARSQLNRETLKTAVTEIYNGLPLKLASLDQLLLGKAIYLGDISDEADSELLEFNDVLDFITIYNTFEEKINSDNLIGRIDSPLIKKTLKRLIDLAKKTNK